MPTFIPCDTITANKTVAYIRQNSWRKNTDIIKILRVTKKMHTPWAHTKAAVDRFLENPTGFLESMDRGKGMVKIVMELPIGSPVLVPNGNRGLLTRITSEMKTGVIEGMCIACSPRVCGHSNMCGANGCAVCDESIREVFHTSDIQKIDRHLKDGNILEPFWSLYRDIEIIGDVDYNGVSGNSIAGMNSAGKWTRYWIEQN